MKHIHRHYISTLNTGKRGTLIDDFIKIKSFPVSAPNNDPVEQIIFNPWR
jgi:hypothetical protein